MQPQAIFDYSVWSHNVRRLIELTGAKARVIVTDEARLAIQYVMKYTPPNTQSEGTKAVQRDILKTMRPLVAKDFTENKTLNRIVKDGDREKYNNFATYVARGSLKGTHAVPFSPKEHTRFRDRRGRVLADHRQVVIGQSDTKALADYIKAVKVRVGWAKGGWAKAASLLGADVPAWVSHHAHDASGDFIDQRTDPEGPQVTIVNHTAWARNGEGARVVRNALKTRSNIMRRKIDAMIRESALKSDATIL